MPLTRDEIMKKVGRMILDLDDFRAGVLDESVIDRSSPAYKKYQEAVERFEEVDEESMVMENKFHAMQILIHFARVLIEGEGYQKGGGE
jgi:hypothetical protein